MISMAEFWEENTRLGKFVSNLFRLPGFTLECVRLDWMHLADLGILQTAMGEVCTDLFFFFGGVYTNSKGACSKISKLTVI